MDLMPRLMQAGEIVIRSRLRDLIRDNNYKRQQQLHSLSSTSLLPTSVSCFFRELYCLSIAVHFHSLDK